MLGADGRRLCTGPPQSGRKQESKAQRHLTRAALQQQEQQHRIEYCRSAVFHSKRAKNLRVHAEQDDGQQPANASQEYVDEQGRRIVGGSGSQLVYIGQGRQVKLCLRSFGRRSSSDFKRRRKSDADGGIMCVHLRWKWADLENYPSPGKELGGLTGGWPGGALTLLLLAFICFPVDLMPVLQHCNQMIYKNLVCGSLVPNTRGACVQRPADGNASRAAGACAWRWHPAVDEKPIVCRKHAWLRRKAWQSCSLGGEQWHHTCCRYAGRRQPTGTGAKH